MTSKGLDMVIGEIESSSGRGDYKIHFVRDADGHEYLTCSCPGWTVSKNNKGKEVWERSCKHTVMAESRFAGYIAGLRRSENNEVLINEVSRLTGGFAAPQRNSSFRQSAHKPKSVDNRGLVRKLR